MRNYTHYHWLDLIRFISAFAVVVSHTSMVFYTNYEGLAPEYHTTGNAMLYLMLRSGAEAVYIFFILSGFLVGGKAIERIQNKTFNIRSYTIDRSVRILLPLIPALIITYIVNSIIGDNYSIWDYTGNLLSLQNIFVPPVNGVLWSLSYEVWFYIIMGGIGLYFTPHGNYNKQIGLIILFIGFMIFTKLNITSMFVWFTGALVFLFVPFKMKAKGLVLTTILLLVSWFYIKQTFRDELLPWLPTPSRSVINLFFALSASLLVAHFSTCIPKRKWSIKLDKIGTSLSKFSYTLYLVHYPILLLLREWGVPVSNKQNPESIFMYLGISILVCFPAYLIYLCSEKHTKSVKEWVNGKVDV